jgi:hypothetical protein
MKRGLILFSLLLLATSACDRNSYSRFSTRYRVFFSCETALSPYNQLTTPGRFLSVRKSEGKLTLTDSDGHKYEETLSAVKNASFIMGLSGLIIGTPTFNNDNMSIWAYDLGCPECESPNTRLKFDLQGSASCSKCGGSWNLNADGIPINSDGKQNRPLYRYPTSFNNGVLTVSN